MVNRIVHYTIGDYLAVFAILLLVLYSSWYFIRDRLTSKRWALQVFYAGVLLWFGVMVYGFLARNWWLFFGSMVIHAFWMAWIRKRMEEKDDDDSK